MAPILIDGSTGYLGSHLVHRLQNSGLPVRCLVRSTANSVDVDLLRSCQAEVVRGDLPTDKSQLKRAFEQVDLAIHLIGSVAPKRHESLTNLHVEQTSYFAELCLQAGIKKVIMVTALGASPDATSNYLKTKWQAEEVLRKSGLSCIFLRPSLLIGKSFGLRDSKLVRRLRELIESKAIIPLIGGGKNKIQPLFINDMVEAIFQCIQSQESASGDRAPTFELGGPRVLTMKEFVQELMRAMNVQKPLVSLPIPVSSALALLAQTFQEIPIFSQDQLKLSMRDNICTSNALTETLHITPTSIGEALQSYTKATKNNCGNLSERSGLDNAGARTE